MRCRLCLEPAGWWRRSCDDCRRLAATFAANRGADMGRLMELFIATGVPREKVDRFLDADPRGTGTLRDQIAADMSNQLLQALGRRGEQTARDVKRIRERGNWTNRDQRPRE
jgi:hypothetical protein